jgi:hypothetical protein
VPVFAVVFGAAALRALLLVRTGAHHLHHGVGALAMVHMVLVPGRSTASHTMASHAAGHAGTIPLSTGLLLAYFTGYVLWTGVRIAPRAAAAAGGTTVVGWAGEPEVATASRLAMAMVMLAILLAS